MKRIFEKYKWNIAGGLLVAPYLVNAIIGLFGWHKDKGVGDGSALFIGLGFLGALVFSTAINLVQHKFGKNHGFGWEEIKEALFSLVGSFAGAPIAYLIYTWKDSFYLQLGIGAVMGSIVFILWGGLEKIKNHFKTKK